MNEDARKKPIKKDDAARLGPCETCVHFDVLDESGVMGCTVDFDEDELWRQRTGAERGCPYYRLYDEYLSVRRQN